MSMPPPVHEVDDPPAGDGERAAPKLPVGQWREQTPTTTPCGGARHSQVDLRSEVNELREALRAARRQLEHYGV